MSNAAIEANLADRLSALVWSPELEVVANVEEGYRPTIGKMYLEARFFPAPTDTPWVGRGRYRYSGIFQVTVVAERNNGVTEALNVGDAIVSHFEKGTVIDGNGVRVKVNRQPSQATPTGDGAWLRVPVSINYHCMA